MILRCECAKIQFKTEVNLLQCVADSCLKRKEQFVLFVSAVLKEACLCHVGKIKRGTRI